MKKSMLLGILFLFVMFLVSCGKNTLKMGTTTFPDDECGFNFENEEIIQLPGGGWRDFPDLVNQMDLGWSDEYISAVPTIQGQNLSTGLLLDMGSISFESLKEAPIFEQTEWISFQINHVYCLKTRTNKYAKIVLTKGDFDMDSLTIKWKYQTNGSRVLE